MRACCAISDGLGDLQGKLAAKAPAYPPLLLFEEDEKVFFNKSIMLLAFA